MLNERSTSLVADRFIQIQTMPNPVLPTQELAVLDYHQTRLQIPDDIDPAWVAELMKALS